MTAWTWICLAPCLLIAIALALFAGYALLDHAYGPQGAKLVWRHELGQFAVLMIFLVAVSPALDAVGDQDFEAFILAMLLAACLIVSLNTFVVKRRIRTADNVVFRCEERKKTAVLSLTVMVLLGVAAVTFMFILVPQAGLIYQITVILIGLFIILLGLNFYYRTMHPLILTATDLIAGGSVYGWNKVRLYYIAPPQRYAPLILRLQGWFPFTDTAIVPLALDEVDEVSTLLNKQLPGLRYSEQPTSDDMTTKLA